MGWQDTLTDFVRRLLNIERRLDRIESIEVPTIGGGPPAVGAPNDAAYVTLSLDAGLTNERVLTEGPDIDLIDTGANGTITVGRGGDSVLLFDSGGNPVAEYAASDAGLIAALAAAGVNDIVELPAIAIAGGPWTIPANVTLRGAGIESSPLTGNTTVNGRIEQCNIDGECTIAATGGAIFCKLTGSTGKVVTLSGGLLYFCRIIATHPATHSVYSTVGAGRYGVFNCSIESQGNIAILGIEVNNTLFEMHQTVVKSSGVGAIIENAKIIANCSIMSSATHAMNHTAGTATLVNSAFIAPVGSMGINNTAAGLSVCDCHFQTCTDITLLTFLFGDRSSWDTIVAGGPDAHARDVWADTHTIHLPEPTGNVVDAGKAPLLNAGATEYELGSIIPAPSLSDILYSEQDTANPPTYDDIVSAFGLPNTGMLGILNDNADESHVYICGATIMGWWYANLAKSAMLAAAMLSVITTDTMTDGAGTHLNVHTPDVGGAWTENSGSWTIQAGGDVRQATAAGAYYIATQDAGKADFQARTLIGTVDAAGVTFGGVIFRYSDASNFWIAAINNDVAPIVALRKVVAGVPTDVDTKSWVSKHQVWIAIEVTCDGNDITVIVDGGFTLSATDAFNNTATKVGIGEYRDGTYKAHGFDDFQIVDLPTYPWTRTGTVVDETEAWESGGTLEPTVLYDTDPKILAGDFVWKMWYSGSWAHPEGVGYAESLDGITWTKYSGNPIATAPRHCHVMKVGDTYYMYGSDDTVNRTRVNLWTSPDGLTWTLDTTACISVGGGGTWDDSILGNTFVWRESSTAWYMLYDATDTLVAGIGMTFRTGLATSTDGRTWVKSPANPVIDYSGQEAGSPWLMKADDGYYYLFGLGSTYGFAPTAIWRWRSLNLTTWERLPYFTIIPRVGATEGEDTYDGQTADPFIVEHDGVAYLYFTGVQDAYTGGSRIVLATADARAIRGY